MSPKPVFFDPQGTRRKRVSFWAASLGLIFAILTTAFIVSFSVVPLLPKVKGLSDSLHRPNRLIPRLPDVDKRRAMFLANKARQELNAEIVKDRKALALENANAQKAPAGSPIVAAFYAPWQEAVGISSFALNAKSLTHVMPAWLRLDAKDPSQLDTKDFDPSANTKNPEFIDIARRNGVSIWPVLSNSNGVTDTFDPKLITELLDSPEKQVALAENVRDWLTAHQFDGLNLDFENASVSDQDRLPQFLAILQKTLRSANLGLSIDLEAGNEDARISKLAANVDLVIVMAYDEHFEGGEPGPIASIDWTEKVLTKYAKAVPPNKLVIGIGSYAYDWAKGITTEAPTYQAALKTAEDNRDQELAADVLDFDETSGNTHYTYEDDNDLKHDVWLLDGASAFNQWKLAHDQGVRGSALWMLGTEDPSIWKFLNKQSITQAPDPSVLRTVEFGPDELEFMGQGDLLYAKGEPKTATRDIQLDKDSGLIVDENYQGYPSSYYVQRAGYKGRKTVALTFDDGPDPTYTPQILDVLKQYNVPATFFIIGRNAESYPSIVRSMFDDGHEIGSHTFNHPNLDQASDHRTELELNATQRAIQGITGRTTVLFRPPFNADIEPTAPQDVRPIILASRLGYVTVGENIDPQDWRRHKGADDTGPLRDPQEIVDAVLYQLAKSDPTDARGQHAGNTILLHDGGGDRSATVRALKILIPELQSKGYKFVPVSALLDTTRDAVMPPIGVKDRTLVGLDQFAFTTIFAFEWFLRAAFLLAIGLGLARVVINVPLALLHERRKFVVDPLYKPSVSVLIAAFNEEAVIERTISSILASEYHVDEVIVVDDGSHDATFLQVVTQFAGEPRVVALKQENGGKASALNRALSQARGELLVCIDADTQLMPDAIGHLAPHFKDRKIGAVAGNVKVGNRLNILTRWQSIEYITSQNLDRRAYAELGAISVCPGAIGAWRKTAIVEAGGYVSDTLAEDMDLTWRLQRAGWTIETESAAIAYTEAPDTLKGFFGQRFRWAYGTLQCLWKHRRAMGKHGWFGWLTLPSLWLFQIVFQVLAPLVDVQLLYTAILAFAAWLTSSTYTKDWRPAVDVMQTLESVAFLYGLFFTVELISGVIAYRLDRERAGSLWWLFLQRLVYRQIMYVVIYKSLVTAIRGRRQGWGKLERKATVELEKHDPRERAALK